MFYTLPNTCHYQNIKVTDVIDAFFLLAFQSVPTLGLHEPTRPFTERDEKNVCITSVLLQGHGGDNDLLPIAREGEEHNCVVVLNEAYSPHPCYSETPLRNRDLVLFGVLRISLSSSQ